MPSSFAYDLCVPCSSPRLWTSSAVRASTVELLEYIRTACPFLRCYLLALHGISPGLQVLQGIGNVEQTGPKNLRFGTVNKRYWTGPGVVQRVQGLVHSSHGLLDMTRKIEEKSTARKGWETELFCRLKWGRTGATGLHWAFTCPVWVGPQLMSN